MRFLTVSSSTFSSSSLLLLRLFTVAARKQLVLSATSILLPSFPLPLRLHHSYRYRNNLSSQQHHLVRYGWTASSLSLFVTSTTTTRLYDSSSSSSHHRMSRSVYYTERRYEDNDERRPRIIVHPTNEMKQNAVVVILHGLGDTADGWVDVAEQWIRAMPYCKFILPTAPIQSVSMNMGMKMPSWYDIIGLDERSNENCPGIEQSQNIIKSILEEEHTMTGLPYHRMILCGFSQGGALSIFTGYQLTYHTNDDDTMNKLGGVVAMSGYLPAMKKFHVTPGLTSIPLLHCHGKQDPLVPYVMAEKSHAVLKEEHQLQDIQLLSYNIPHTVNPQELSDVLSFLQKLIPNDDTYQITLQDPTTMSLKQMKENIKRLGLTSLTRGFLEKSDYVQLLQQYRQGKL